MNEDEMYDAYLEQEMEEVDAGSVRLMFLNEQHEQNFAAITEQYKFDIATDSDLIVAYIAAVPDVYEKVSGALLSYDSWLLDEQFATEQSDTFNALLGVALSYRLGVEPSKLRAYEQMLDGPYWVVVALGVADIYTNGMFNTLKSMEVL